MRFASSHMSFKCKIKWIYFFIFFLGIRNKFVAFARRRQQQQQPEERERRHSMIYGVIFYSNLFQIFISIFIFDGWWEFPSLLCLVVRRRQHSMSFLLNFKWDVIRSWNMIFNGKLRISRKKIYWKTFRHTLALIQYVSTSIYEEIMKK